MDLQKLFNVDLIKDAQSLFIQNKVIILNKGIYHVEAIIHDDIFYKIDITFNYNYSIVHMRVSKDGFTDVCPFTTPYAAAVLYKLHTQGNYGLTLNSNVEPHHFVCCESYEPLSSKSIASLSCYNRLLTQISKYVIRLQNYNTDSTFMTFSSILDEIFEYFDTIQDKHEKMVTIQVFLHTYMVLDFDFEYKDDIDYAILDECDYLIHQIIASEDNPHSRYLYQTILLNDTKISPYISDFNKTSSIRN
ncbi:MAG: hypothetical protein GX038_05400 [Erysipelothrix sp.]|nr:hypothetical protein [Erysipelothrix sp.]